MHYMFIMYDFIYLGQIREVSVERMRVCEMTYENSQCMTVYKHGLTTHYMFIMYDFLYLGQLREASDESSHQIKVKVVKQNV